MGDEALLPLRLFRRSVFATGSAQALIIGMGMFGGIAAIPLYLQIVKGASPTKAGLLLLPLIAGMMTASLASGQFTSRTGRYKIFPVVGSILMVIGIALMTGIGADTPLWQADIYMAIFGMGLGMNMQSIVLAMQSAVDPQDMGVATSAVTFFRQVGGSLGTAVFLSILFTRAATNIPHELAKSGVNVPAGAFDINNTSGLAKLPTEVRHPILVGFSNAMDTVFLVGAFVLLIGVVLSALMKEIPLRSVSGQQARAAAERDSQAVAVTSAAPAAASAAPSDVVPLATRAEQAAGAPDS
jgi:MFS family permease